MSARAEPTGRHDRSIAAHAAAQSLGRQAGGATRPCSSVGPCPVAQSGPAAAAPAHTAAAPARRRDWTDLPEAAALLADCAARPPGTRMARVVDLTIRHTRLHVGARVKALEAIHRAEAVRLFAAAEAAGDYAAFDRHCRRNVQQAIADFLLHAALARSAACDRRALEAVK